MPRGGKLYCQACDESFELSGDSNEDFKIIKKIRHDDSEESPIIIKNVNETKIGAEDRKAYEEFFSGSEESGY
ncbi:MAG: hypothetical protein ACFFAT_20055 [Promethearchaeota archaeon]